MSLGVDDDVSIPETQPKSRKGKEVEKAKAKAKKKDKAKGRSEGPVIIADHVGKMPSQNWSDVEEETLARAWVNISIAPDVGMNFFYNFTFTTLFF